MKRAHWIILLALAALNMVVMGAGLTALGTSIFAPAEWLPTLMPPAFFVPVAAITAVPPAQPSAQPSALSVVRLTNTLVAQATRERIASPEPTPLSAVSPRFDGGAQAAATPEAVESSPTVEPSATEGLASPTAGPAPAEAPLLDTPTAEVILEPPPAPAEAATLAPAAPTATTVPTETPVPTATAVPPTATLVVALNAPPSYFVPATAHASQIFLQGQILGNRADAFALVGDSNTDNPNFFAPFDNGNYALGDYAYLQETISFFRGSFAQHSPAAVGSFNTSKVLDPAYADPVRCLAGETPLACEYRLLRPSVVLILIGTGDHLDWPNFEGRYRRILDYTLAQGIVPVLLTKADDLESKEQGAPYDFTNNIIRRLSREYDLPLLDLRRAVELLPNRGCGPDGFHYNTPPDGRSADFTGGRLNYGYNVRNLTGLLALDQIRRQVLLP